MFSAQPLFVPPGMRSLDDSAILGYNWVPADDNGTDYMDNITTVSDSEMLGKSFQKENIEDKESTKPIHSIKQFVSDKFFNFRQVPKRYNIK